MVRTELLLRPENAYGEKGNRRSVQKHSQDTYYALSPHSHKFFVIVVGIVAKTSVGSLRVCAMCSRSRSGARAGSSVLRRGAKPDETSTEISIAACVS